MIKCILWKKFDLQDEWPKLPTFEAWLNTQNVWTVSWASFFLLVNRVFFVLFFSSSFKRFLGLVINYYPEFFKYFLFKRKWGQTQRIEKIKASRALHDIFISSLHIPIGIWEPCHEKKNGFQILYHDFVLIKYTFSSGREVLVVENSMPLIKIQIYTQSSCCKTFISTLSTPIEASFAS